MFSQLEEEGDVYDVVDEDQYASIVERRRNEDDFVVDDSKFTLQGNFNFLVRTAIRISNSSPFVQMDLDITTTVKSTWALARTLMTVSFCLDPTNTSTKEWASDILKHYLHSPEAPEGCR